MIKEILRLFAIFGVAGGVMVAPGLIKEQEVIEPTFKLPVIGTYDNLKEIVKSASNNSGREYFIMDGMASSLQKSTAANSLESLDSTGASDYSSTNVQVQGVDEADIMKNDDEYLYHLVNNELIISKIFPVNAMKVITTINYSDFSPSQLYVDNNLVIVIGSYYKSYKDERYWGESYTKVIIYDFSSEKELKIVKEVEVSGNYNSSRLIDNCLYFVTNKGIDMYMFDDENCEVMPLYRDSSVNSDFTKVNLEDVRYFPGYDCSQYLMTVGVDLSDLSKVANISTYLGNSESMYSSKDNMYLTFTDYNSREESTGDEPIALKKIFNDVSNMKKYTGIYRFKLENGEMNCKATGKIEGSILNQFSMDENEGYFRIATTKGRVTGVGENRSTNNIHVLDKELKTIGKIEDIAPGEKIYSVRYMGNRAYMVTFRKVDPLFVIDLSKPENPQILGKLKIPGYSDYLHPYDETHIIGFGKDAEVVSNEEGSWGWADEDGQAAYYQGMKIAMFDVSNPEKPVEMWKEEIGDRGTDSELLSNHKALLFSKDKNLLAFPIKVTTVSEKNAKAWDYGDTTFVGAYVYELTLEKGFVLKAKLTNLSDSDWAKLGSYYYGDKSIDRLIYMDNVIYTISAHGYVAYNMKDYSEIGRLEI